MIICLLCQNLTEEMEYFCKQCREKYPDVLLKTILNKANCMAGLRDGTIVQIEEVMKIKGEWLSVKLYDFKHLKYDGFYVFPEEFWIRLSDIVWIVPCEC